MYASCFKNVSWSQSYWMARFHPPWKSWHKIGEPSCNLWWDPDWSHDEELFECIILWYTVWASQVMIMREWDHLCVYIYMLWSKQVNDLVIHFFPIIPTSLQTKDPYNNRQTLSGSQSMRHLAAWSLAESQALLVSHVVETTLQFHFRFEQACTTGFPVGLEIFHPACRQNTFVKRLMFSQGHLAKDSSPTSNKVTIRGFSNQRHRSNQF